MPGAQPRRQAGDGVRLGAHEAQGQEETREPDEREDARPTRRSNASGATSAKMSSMMIAPIAWPTSDVRLNAKVPRTWSRSSR